MSIFDHDEDSDGLFIYGIVFGGKRKGRHGKIRKHLEEERKTSRIQHQSTEKRANTISNNEKSQSMKKTGNLALKIAVGCREYVNSAPAQLRSLIDGIVNEIIDDARIGKMNSTQVSTSCFNLENLIRYVNKYHISSFERVGTDRYLSSPFKTESGTWRILFYRDGNGVYKMDFVSVQSKTSASPFQKYETMVFTNTLGRLIKKLRNNYVQKDVLQDFMRYWSTNGTVAFLKECKGKSGASLVECADKFKREIIGAYNVIVEVWNAGKQFNYIPFGSWVGNDIIQSPSGPIRVTCIHNAEVNGKKYSLCLDRYNVLLGAINGKLVTSDLEIPQKYKGKKI